VLVPDADLARVHDAHDRFLRAVETLTDEDVRVPSRLPGWTIGHVLTHVARNADSHVRRAEAALVGEIIDQYEGGYAGRALAIEVGSLRPVADIIDDVSSSARVIEALWRRLPADAWTGRSRDVNGRERPLFELPSRRWQEVEVHVVDLDVGVSHRDWSPEFILEWLPRTRERMWSQLPTEATHIAWDHPADELAWLYGRFSRIDLPSPPEWG
jgi:maleylpyruvate isomerase